MNKQASKLISVIVPVYQTEKYLPRAIDSVLAQTVQNWELLMIDDGSQDSSGFICDEYARNDLRIKVIHKTNGGVSSARNAALAVAQGEYVIFLDSDDCLSPFMLEYLLDAIQKNDCDIAQCNYLDFSGSFPDFGAVPKSNIAKILPLEKVLDHLEEMNFIVMWNKLYKRSLFDGVAFKGRIHEEIATAFKIYFKAEKVAVLDTVLYGYFSNPNSLSTEKIKLSKQFIIDAYEEQLRFFTEKNILSCRRKALANLANVSGFLLDFRRSRYEDYDLFVKELTPRFQKIYTDLKNEKDLKFHLRLLLQCSCGQLQLFYILYKVKNFLGKVLQTLRHSRYKD